MNKEKMQNVITVRLPNEDVRMIEELSEEEKIDKSTAIRELVELGRIYSAILKYQKGEVSIGRCAEIAGIKLSQMMDLLSELGIKSKLDVMDYLEGKKGAKKALA